MKKLWLVVCVVLVAFVACGGDTADDTASDTGGDADAPAAETSVPTELFADDLEQVCAGGTVAATPEYDGAKGEIHPMVAFEGAEGDYTEMSLDFPEGWTVMYPEYQTAELVACLDRTSEKLVKTCEGYESDDSDEKFSVDLYNATYDVTVYAANTGEEVATTTLEAKDDECPFIAFFDEGEETQIEYASADNLLRSFMKEYVAP